MIKIRKLKTNYNFKKAFTMIELLIVIAIIGILTTASFFAIRGTREGARDSQRKSDLSAISNALSIYKSDCNYYPDAITSGNKIKGNDAPCTKPATNVYMEVVPQDSITGRKYYYEKLSCVGTTNCTRFKIWASLEDPGTTPAGCTPIPAAGSCGTGYVCNYCVTNP